MTDDVLARLDAMLGAHEAAVAKLRGLRELYVAQSIADVRGKIAGLVRAHDVNAMNAIADGNGAGPKHAAPITEPPTPTTLVGWVMWCVAEKAGRDASELIDAVLTHIKPKSAHPRRAVAAAYDDLVKREKIAKRSGRFYPIGNS